MNESHLTLRDLYRLRHSYLLVQRAAFRAQHTQLKLQCQLLELERRYGLLTRQAVLDIQTGAITEAQENGNQSL